MEQSHKSHLKGSIRKLEAQKRTKPLTAQESEKLEKLCDEYDVNQEYLREGGQSYQ